MDAGAYELERLVNRAFDVGKVGGNPGLVGVDHAQGLGLQRSTRELVSDVVVNFARDAGALGQGRKFDLIVLAIGEVAVARFEREGSFLQLIARAAHALLLTLQLGCAQRQQGGGNRKDDGQQKRSGGERVGAKVRDERKGKSGDNAQRDPDVLTAHPPRNVIEGEGRKRHKRRHEDSRDEVSVARGLARTAGAVSLCDFGQRGGNNAKAKRRDQASVHSKTHGGRNTARQNDRFVEKPVHTGIVREAAHGGGAAYATVTFFPRGKAGASAGRTTKTPHS